MHFVTHLDINRGQVHISVLYLASVSPLVFNGYGLASGGFGILVYRHHFAVILGSQHRIALTADVHTLVHLLFVSIHGVGTHSKR